MNILGLHNMPEAAVHPGQSILMGPKKKKNGTILSSISALQAQSSEFSFHLKSLCSSSRPYVLHHHMDTLWKCKMLQTVE
jgi:hypothetical protein